MKKLTIISIVLMVSAFLILPSFSVAADEGVPWFGLIPYLLTGGPNKPPVAFFSADPTSGDVPLTVDFDALDSEDPDDSIVSYKWDFGDGGSGAGEQFFHTYGNAGKYTVTLTVEDKAGATDNFNRTITVGGGPTPDNQPPNASYTYDPKLLGYVDASSVVQTPSSVVQTSSEGVKEETVTFNGSDSTDPDGSIYSHDWDFDDGSAGSGVQAYHEFTDIGNFNVKLTVEDNQGATGTTSKTLLVYPFSLGGGGIGWKDGNILQVVNNKVVTINLDTGEAVDILEVEAQETVNLYSVTYDGTDIWVLSTGGYNDNYFYRVDPATGDIKESVPTVSEPGFLGLTWGNSYLWSVNPTEDKIYKIEPSTGNIVSNIPAPNAHTVSVTWAKGYLWASGWASGRNAEEFCKVDPSDGSIVDSFTASVMNHAKEMTWDGSYLWCIKDSYAHLEDEKIFRIDTDTGELVSP